MYNGTEKEKIDIDELVDFLVKRRETTEEPEQLTPEERDVFAHIKEDPEVFIPEDVVEPEPEHEPEGEIDPAEILMPTLEEEEEEVTLFETDKDLKPEMMLEFEPPVKKETVTPVADPHETTEVVIPNQNAEWEEMVVEKPFPMLEPLMQPKKKKRWFGLFGAKEEAPEEETWADWGLKPLGHNEPEPVKVIPEEQPAAPVEDVEDASGEPDEFPAVTAVAETITMQVVLPSGVAIPRAESATKVIPTIPEEALMAEPVKSAKPEKIEPEPNPEQNEQLPDQLSLEEMVRVEDIEPAEEVEEDETAETPEELLQRTRQEKVREFTLGGEEEEENEPEEEFDEPQEEQPTEEDFTGYEDSRLIAEELHYRSRSSLITLLITGLVELVLLVLTLLTALAGDLPVPLAAYLLIQLFGLGLMMGLNYRAVGRGFSGLFMLRANSDTAPALAGTVVLVDVMLRFSDASVQPPYWAPLAGLLLTFCALGHYLHAQSVRRNFAFVSYHGDKYAATLIEEENAVREIGRRAAGTGEATVGYFHRTAFLTDYLSNAEEDHQGDDWSRWMVPTALGVSVLLSLLAWLMSDFVVGFFGWMTVFTGLVCLTMPATQMAVQLPLSHCGRTMLARGGFLVGWKAVRQFGQLDALVVDMADLYPDESMLLHGIKTFSGTHIDEAILSAASLVVRSGGPLSMIFRRIIENKEELLSEVESLVYEQGMGLSGWVDGRRVFVGNRRLLQNHGVDVPSADYEARYAKDGRRLVYLSIAGQLSAMFVVSYLPDPEIQDALQDLCRSHVTLLVRSCDPNIATLDLCRALAWTNIMWTCCRPLPVAPTCSWRNRPATGCRLCWPPTVTFWVRLGLCLCAAACG